MLKSARESLLTPTIVALVVLKSAVWPLVSLTAKAPVLLSKLSTVPLAVSRALPFAVAPVPVPVVAEGVVVAGAVVSGAAPVVAAGVVYAVDVVTAAVVGLAAVVEAVVVAAEVVAAGAVVALESPQAASSTSKKENSTMAVRGIKLRRVVTLFIN